MNIGCKSFRKGDVYKGYELISEPYKIDGSREYHADCKCVFDGIIKRVCLSDLKRQVFDGCGCQKSRVNSINWKSFKQWCIENDRFDILNLWDYEINEKNPNEVSCCTAKEFYFKCPDGKHKTLPWKLIALTRRNKVKTICKYCNSFAQHLTDRFGENALELYWDYDKNNVNPWDINWGARCQVWIKCQKHGSYLVDPKTFLKSIWQCSQCAQEKESSRLQECVKEYIINHYNYNISHERNCNIIATNPKTNYQLPYDNEVRLPNNKYLIIEVMGKQHYEICGLTILTARHTHITPEQVFHNQQYRDEYKKQYALSQGYHYLAIPYWTECDESYKTLIDNKIHEILTLTQQND